MIMTKESYLKPDLQIIEIETEQIMGNSPSLPKPGDGDQSGDITNKPQNSFYNNRWSSEFEGE